MSRPPRIAILGSDLNTSVKPLSRGLQRMLSKVGATGTIFEQGLNAVRRRSAVAAANGGGMARRLLADARFYDLALKLRRYDAIVVVRPLPVAFHEGSLRDDELRRIAPGVPIVHYAVVYLPTRGPYVRRMLEDGARGRETVFGLDRYDWYLTVSIVSEYPPPSGIGESCSVIGLDLDDGGLRPEPKDEFLALMDFERQSEMKERAIQISALEKTKTPYLALNGDYSVAAIREIYRRCSLYFVAFRESFGVPICELQACGAYIFTPYEHWCPSHWIKADISVPGPGVLPPNFLVYDGDEEKLVDAVERARASYDSRRIVESFLTHHPQYFRGDLNAVSRFVDRLRTGEIHSRLHEAHPNLKTLVDRIGL
jgi:hypothetical protein